MRKMENKTNVVMVCPQSWNLIVPDSLCAFFLFMGVITSRVEVLITQVDIKSNRTFL